METINGTQALGLSDEQQEQLRARLQSTLVQVVRSPKGGRGSRTRPSPTANVKFNPKEITVQNPKFKK